MKKTYLKPKAEIETFSVRNAVSISVQNVQLPPDMKIKYTKGKLNF